MINTAVIFTKGGVILWSYSFDEASVKESVKEISNFLIHQVLLQDRLALVSLTYKHSQLYWTIINRIDVVFVVAVDNTPSHQVQKILETFKSLFEKLILTPLDETIQKNKKNMTSIQAKLLESCEINKTNLTAFFLNILNTSYSQESGVNELTTAQNRKSGKKKQPDEKIGLTAKSPTTWDIRKVTKQAMAALDLSKDSSTNLTKPIHCVHESTSESECELTSDTETSSLNISGFLKRIQSKIQSITGNQTITETEIGPLLAEFESLLMSKNVALEVSKQIVESVRLSLLGTKTNTLTSVRYTLQEAITQAVQRVLTQNNPIDVLKNVRESSKVKKVFSICFLGVNGVGKSTSLAKVAYLLKNKGKFNVMIAACDTFRSGAIEQLQTHANNLNIFLFEQGYGKDAAIVCKNALKHAQTEGYDVVLIDTAGRMQDNEPLMQALAKLVSKNEPDLIFFVGEALTGNDAVHQLNKFSETLKHNNVLTSNNPRNIDGIILTKFDTVDTKMGTALNLSYVSNLPVVYVGTGQKYTQLQRFEVKSVVKALFKD